MSLFASSSIWHAFQKPLKNLNSGNFFEAKAYENLFSELRMAQGAEDRHCEEDDASTNAPESRTTSTLINAEKGRLREEPLVESKHVQLKGRIGFLLGKPLDHEMTTRFGEVMELEHAIEVNR